MIFEPLAPYAGWVLFAIRILLGISLIVFGLPKIRDLASNAQDFRNMGFHPGLFWGTLIAFLEFFGGIAILLGFFAGIFALLFGIEMIVGTVWKIVKRKGFADYSYDLILLALAAILLTFGSGRLSIMGLSFS